MGCIFSIFCLKNNYITDNYTEPLLKKEVSSSSSIYSQDSPPSYFETILFNKFEKYNND